MRICQLAMVTVLGSHRHTAIIRFGMGKQDGVLLTLDTINARVQDVEAKVFNQFFRAPLLMHHEMWHMAATT